MTAPRRHILVVDDEANIRMTLRATLEAAGYDVDETAYGESAVTKCAERVYDLVLLDLRLPGIDGLEVLRRIRSHGPMVPVIMLTAYGTIDTAVEAMRCGAAEFLQKPFTPDALRSVVTRVLAGADVRPHLAADYEMLVADALREADTSSYDDAESAAGRALAADPGRPEAWNLMGGIAELRGNRERAVAFYRSTLALDPGFEPARSNLARATGPAAWGPVFLSRIRSVPQRGGRDSGG